MIINHLGLASLAFAIGFSIILALHFDSFLKTVFVFFLYLGIVSGAVAIVCLAAVAFLGPSKSFYRKKPTLLVKRAGLRFLLWFWAQGFAVGALSCLAASCAIWFFGWNIRTTAFCAGATACVAVAIMGGFYFRRRHLLGLCWDKPLFDGIRRWQDKTKALFFLKERYRLARRIDLDEPEPVLLAFTQILDTDRIDGAQIFPDKRKLSPSFRYFKREAFQRIAGFGVIFSLAFAVTFALQMLVRDENALPYPPVRFLVGKPPVQNAEKVSEIDPKLIAAYDKIIGSENKSGYEPFTPPEEQTPPQNSKAGGGPTKNKSGTHAPKKENTERNDDLAEKRSAENVDAGAPAPDESRKTQGPLQSDGKAENFDKAASKATGTPEAISGENVEGKSAPSRQETQACPDPKNDAGGNGTKKTSDEKNAGTAQSESAPSGSTPSGSAEQAERGGNGKPSGSNRKNDTPSPATARNSGKGEQSGKSPARSSSGAAENTGGKGHRSGGSKGAIAGPEMNGGTSGRLDETTGEEMVKNRQNRHEASRESNRDGAYESNEEKGHGLQDSPRDSLEPVDHALDPNAPLRAPVLLDLPDLSPVYGQSGASGKESPQGAGQFDGTDAGIPAENREERPGEPTQFLPGWIADMFGNQFPEND